MTRILQFRRGGGALGLLRPFGGAVDIPFNPRWRDMQIGVTKPTADNTGVLPGSTLTPVFGSVSNTVAGAVYKNLDIRGTFSTTAPCVLYNCRVRIQTLPGSNTGIVRCQNMAGSILAIDCEIYSEVTPHSTRISGFLGGNATLLRCHLHDVVDMAKVYRPSVEGDMAGPTNVQILASYGHDFTYISPDPAQADGDNATHADGVQIEGGADTLIRGSRWDMNMGSVTVDSGAGGIAPEDQPDPYGQGVTMTPTRANITDTLVEYSWFDCGKAGVIAEGSAGTVRATVRNNRFGTTIAEEWTLGGIAATRPIVGRTNFFTDFPAYEGAMPGVLEAGQGNVFESTGLPVDVTYRGVG